MSLNKKNISGALFLISTIVLLTALAFEHIGGLKPCALCLQQRYAYYLVIPLSLLCYVLAEDEGKKTVFKILMTFCGMAMLANTGLGVYHAGVEWAWWPGPDTCAAVAGGTLKPDFSGPPPVPCTEAAWRFLGISMAGYNAVMSLVMFTLSSFAICNPAKCAT